MSYHIDRIHRAVPGPFDDTLWQVVQVNWHSHGYATVELINAKHRFITATAETVPANGLLDRLCGPDRQTTLASLMNQS